MGDGRWEMGDGMENACGFQFALHSDEKEKSDG